MNKPTVLIGERYGHWTVVKEVGRSPDRHRLLLCLCDCGNFAKVQSNNLRTGASTQCKSCQGRLANYKHGAANNGPLYSLWGAMIQRCVNPNRKSYRYYGGRGIKVCDRWRNSFEAFRSDLPPRPSKEFMLERTNNDRGYEPGNVKWATAKEQANNTRRNRRFTFNGQTLTLSEWAEIIGILPSALWQRLSKGQPLNVALKFKNIERRNPTTGRFQ